MTGQTKSGLTISKFEKTVGGKEVKLIVLSTSTAELCVSNYGGTFVSYSVLDKNKKFTNIVLTLPSLESYETENPFIGVTVGRYANRIQEGKFKLAGGEYTLPVNNGPNNLHTGPHGAHYSVWDIVSVTATTVVLKIVLSDGTDGFPGTLTTSMTVSLVDSDVNIKYESTTDKPTVCNFTNHSYFNLLDNSSSILQTKLTIDADYITPVNKYLIPTGELLPVEGTPFDFREPHLIGERVDSEDEQLKLGGGYDHNFALREFGFARAARAENAESGIFLEIYTDLPGLQFFSGNWGDSQVGLNGEIKPRSGFCLEPGFFPDTPNQPAFPSCALHPDETYSKSITFKTGLV